MSKKEKTVVEVQEEPTEPENEIYYVVNIYDNHGTINITQSGNPPPPPSPPGGNT